MNKQILQQGWKEDELGEITECLDGKRIPLNDEERKKIKGEIPYYGANGQVDSINKFIFDEELLLITEDGGSWGLNQKCAYIIRGKSWVNNHAHVLRVKKEKVDISFLKYWLNKQDLNKYISGTTRGKLNQKIMNKIKIPLPPLQIQKHIVSILEKAGSLKLKREDADRLIKEYLQSVFYEMFYNKGFEEVELGTVCEFNPKKAEIRDIDENLEVSFVPMADVQEHQIYFELKDSKKIKEIFTGYTYFKENDVLLAKVTPCFENGKSGIARNLKNGIGFGSSEFFVLRPSNKILSPLIYYLISSDKFINAGKKQMTGTGGLRRLSKNYVTEYQIPLPPIHLQQKFASIVEQVEELKEKQKQSKEEINIMFDSLMKQAFKGELVK